MYKPVYFTEEEFNRVGCSLSDINLVSLRRLDLARKYADVPFVLTSAYRSNDKNSSVHGARNSAHLRGRAFDISCRSNSVRFRIISGALSAGFTRIGIGKNFVHLDDDPSLRSNVVWLY